MNCGLIVVFVVIMMMAGLVRQGNAAESFKVELDWADNDR